MGLCGSAAAGGPRGQAATALAAGEARKQTPPHMPLAVEMDNIDALYILYYSDNFFGFS